MKRLLKTHVPETVWTALVTLVGEVKLLRVHSKGVRQARTFTPPLKLNVGCGNNLKAGWVNIDLSGPADLPLDMRRPLPFPDGSCTAIYSEHFFEHLSLKDGTRFARESLRVLVPGGTISIGVPDAEGILRIYADDDREAWREDRDRWHPAYCTTPMHSVNYNFRQEGEHHYAYDFETLAELLTSCGFVGIRRREWDAAMDTDCRRIGTLYVDAAKKRGHVPQKEIGD